MKKMEDTIAASDQIQKVIAERAHDSWWLNSENKVVGKYGKIFNPSNLDRLTKEDFKSFLLIKNNLHWEGIHRQDSLVTADMQALIKFLKFILDESTSIKDRLNTDFVEKGGYWVKGIGRAVITPILLVVYPNKYGVWNSRSEAALKKMSLFPHLSSKDSFADKYLKINTTLLDLANQYNLTLWQLDGILGEISGSGPFGQTINQEETVEEEAEQLGVVDVADFGMESHLEDFLIANWSKTIFGQNYDLIYEEGDLASQQYQTAVGEIDILAISKDQQEYLVIELKKGRTSDAVVGQILRYMNWIKENLAKEKMVQGAIVILETDTKLSYSLKGREDIHLYTYEVNFKLNLRNL